MRKAYLTGTAIIGLGLLLWSLADRSGAQVINDQAATAQESAARGLSDVISSAGQYNLQTSAAALNMTEVQRREMENQLQSTETYFKNQEINKAYRDKERPKPLTAEQLVVYAQMGKPRQLSPSQLDETDGRIEWPSVLATDEFATSRKQLDDLFAKRAVHGGIGFEEQMEIRHATAAMTEALKQHISDLPPSVYAAAKAFLQSLAYEGTKST